jgi:adenosine deaminase
MRDLPKIELHLHLEGAAPPAFIRGLAQEKGVDLGGVFAPDGGYAFKDFWHFLTVYEAATSVLQTPEDYARLTRAVLEESAENGVIYSETFLSPDFCGGGDVAPGANTSPRSAKRPPRGRAPSLASRCAASSPASAISAPSAPGPSRMRRRDGGRLAGGLRHGGRRTEGQTGRFPLGLRLRAGGGAAHHRACGRMGRGGVGARRAGRAANPERIGHGVQAIEDLALVDRLAEDGIVLECCPGSNVTLGVFPSWREHPIERCARAA